MKHLCTAAAFFAAAFSLPVTFAQHATTSDALQTASVAWSRGDYIAALTTYQELLDGPDADSVLEAIALQTGELYLSTELAADGASPQFSPDGSYLTYEAGPAGGRVTKLLRADGSTMPVAELPGSGAAFSLDGSQIAYLRLPPPEHGGEAGAAAPDAPPAVRAQQLAAASARAARDAEIVIRPIAGGTERVIPTTGLSKSGLVFAAGGALLFGGQAEGQPQQVYAVTGDQAPAPVTQGEGDKAPIAVNTTGDAALFVTRVPPPDGGRGGRGRGALPYSLLDLGTRTATPLGTTDRPAFSADGRWLAFVSHQGDAYRLLTRPATGAAVTPTVVRDGADRMENPALSADGSSVAYELMTDHDWEIYVSPRAGGDPRRLTREIQHDLLPQFLSPDRLLATVGEPRHRRSYLYDLGTGARTRLFHNNTVRTIAPEYSWTPSRDGSKVLIVAERDGDTVSPARGVYLMDLTRKVTVDQLKARVAASLAAERSLRARAEQMFAPIASEVRAVVARASVPRVYGYEKTLFDFDSKHITQPGNARASAFLSDTYRAFGYAPEFQWFEPRGALGGRTANVVATLQGTVNPDLVYVVSSHYDSVAVGPGADDDSSGTAALLETARILAGHPQPATIVFASFTGEEAGLLGSREFVRRAVAGGLHIVGALNNDMIGWANDDRLDNTIRYSNPGIRDVQHGAAMQFTNLITYDALYYKSTDAAAYYEAYGDIVGGIGSYPVLGNPHYHQPHDLLETINHQLVTEVAKTTAATLMLLASSPSRLADVRVDSRSGGAAVISWTPSPEHQITGYLVSATPPSGGPARHTRTTRPTVTLTGVAPGTVIAVKAVNAKGMEGWDWARVTVP